MREILLRGKRVDNGEWLESKSLVRLDDDVFLARCVDVDCTHDENYTQIVCMSSDENPFLTRVDTKSIGQYTGLTDKNGTKIFEGDILQLCSGTYPFKVIYDGLGWKFIRNGKRIEGAFECDVIHDVEICKVIGNIYDNAELLKGE